MAATNRQGEVKNSMGNGEATELTCMTHRHELKWGNAGGRVGTGLRGIKGRKKWDNCNSIIDKIYLKNKIKFLNLITSAKSFSPCKVT